MKLARVLQEYLKWNREMLSTQEGVRGVDREGGIIYRLEQI